MVTDFSLGTVRVASTPLARLEEYLQARGKRMTQQRRMIVEHVFSHHEHFDADSLMDELGRNFGRRKISRPTVYRTLSELVEAGLLVKMDLSGRSVYEHDYGYPNHDHLHCTVCDKLIEFQSTDLVGIRDAVARQNEFRVTGHRLIVSGVCSECQRRKLRPNRRTDRI
jgi:Fur family ferric uptake transcriptional regulator